MFRVFSRTIVRIVSEVLPHFDDITIGNLIMGYLVPDEYNQVAYFDCSRGPRTNNVTCHVVVNLHHDPVLLFAINGMPMSSVDAEGAITIFDQPDKSNMSVHGITLFANGGVTDERITISYNHANIQVCKENAVITRAFPFGTVDIAFREPTLMNGNILLCRVNRSEGNPPYVKYFSVTYVACFVLGPEFNKYGRLLRVPNSTMWCAVNLFPGERELEKLTIIDAIQRESGHYLGNTKVNIIF